MSRLETSLDHSEQRVSELSRALAQSEEQLGQLQSLSEAQKIQLRQLQDVRTQLGGVREMNEVSSQNEQALHLLAYLDSWLGTFFCLVDPLYIVSPFCSILLERIS